MYENLDVFSFDLTDDEISRISALNRDLYTAPNGDNCADLWD